MIRPVGIETEYGLNCTGFGEDIDFAYEASLIVRSAPVERAFRGWDYSREDPRLDLRGERVKSLARDPNDLTDSTWRSSRMSQDELVANTVLLNGARFYNDHNHPEYCTDVCVSLRDLVAQDKAGERLLAACERARNEKADHGRVLVLKNNTDYHSRSYGTHENYLVSRSLDFDVLVKSLLPYLVARQAIVGAGKVGCEGPHPGRAAFQISQRGDFFEETVGINTTARRPIFNTRDEPHADRRKYRRLHVICGDANRSEHATALKAGMTAMILDAIEGGRTFELALREPVRAFREFSRDPELAATAELEDSRAMTALDIMEVYLEAIEEQGPYEGDRGWVAGEWRDLLDLLRREPQKAADRIDWLAKRELFRELQGGPNPLADEDLQRIDLAYHVVNPELSLYDSLVAAGRVRTLVSEGEIESAMSEPPRGTRAEVRGLLLKKFPEYIANMEWDTVTLSVEGRTVALKLDEVVGEGIRTLRQTVSAAESIFAVMDEIGGVKSGHE